jgi:hypothetical protein
MLSKFTSQNGIISSFKNTNKPIWKNSFKIKNDYSSLKLDPQS